HAISAFLYHATAADRDVRVQAEPLATTLRGVAGILKEIKAPHFVGAIVRAIARADAAVVHHVIEPVVAVDRSVDRADQLARRILALLAGHRLELHGRRVDVSD